MKKIFIRTEDIFNELFFKFEYRVRKESRITFFRFEVY